MKRYSPLLGCALAILTWTLPASAQQVAEIIDSSGDGVHRLRRPQQIASDPFGNLFVASGGPLVFELVVPPSVFKIAPDGAITQIMDESGDGVRPFELGGHIATDSDGNVFVTNGARPGGGVFKIETPKTCSTTGTPCPITEIIDSNGDGVNALASPHGLAVDAAGDLLVVGFGSNNVFRIERPEDCGTGGTPCMIREIADATGDGLLPLDRPTLVATDSGGNVFVTSQLSLLRISGPMGCGTSSAIPCTVDDLVDVSATGPGGLATDPSGNVYLGLDGAVVRLDMPQACSRRTSPCVMTEIIDGSGDGVHPYGNSDDTASIAADASGNVFVAGPDSQNAFKIERADRCGTRGRRCLITQIIDRFGDGVAGLSVPLAIESGPSDDVFVAGFFSDNVFEVSSISSITRRAIRSSAHRLRRLPTHVGRAARRSHGSAAALRGSGPGG